MRTPHRSAHESANQGAIQPVRWSMDDERLNALPSRLQDRFTRHVTYLRMSVTDRCDLRCQYCMPERMQFLPKKDLLTLEELAMIGTLFTRMGVRKIRFTGGEPLMRKNFLWLVQQFQPLLSAGYLEEITLTTNGTMLARYADDLFAAGVRRVNISLDSLKAQRYAEITRWGELDTVLRGIDAAKKAGLKVKINCVALKNFNEDEIETFVEYCALQGHDLVFIEVMPMGDLGAQTRLDQFLSLDKVQQRIEQQWGLTPLSDRTGGPARYYRNEKLGNRIGFISPLSHRFCALCNRVRLTCTGTLYTCLGQDGNVDLRTPVRDRHDPLRATVAAIQHGMAIKPEGHDFAISPVRVAQTNRHMNTTGG